MLEPLRLDAIKLVGLSPYPLSEIIDILIPAVGSGESQAIQSATIAALARYRDPLATNLLARWSGLSTLSRQEVIAAMLAYPERTMALLGSVQSGVITMADFSPSQVSLLRSDPVPAIRQQALRLFGPPRARPEAMQQFQSALQLPGLAMRGQQTYLARCAACHSLSGQGSVFALDLNEARLGGKQQILAAILDPNSHQPPGYPTVLVETKAGELLVGVKTDDNPLAITLWQQPNLAPAVWPRTNINGIQPQPWSLMPEGLEQGLTPPAIADLLEYLMIGPALAGGG